VGALHSTFVRKSTDGGTTWRTIFEHWDYSQIKDMVAWNDGIAVIVDYYSGADQGKIKVFATSDDFQHLTELYSYEPAGSNAAYAGSLNVDSRGYLYASGSAADPSGATYTFVAVSRDGTWEKIVDEQGTNYIGEVPDTVFFNDQNQVFYAGTYAPTNVNSTLKVHRATINDPATFTLSPIGNGSANASPIPASSKILFLTKTLTDGNLGVSASAAITAADAICNADPHKPVYATGSFKALLVAAGARIGVTTGNCTGGSGEHIDWPLAASTQYVTHSGRVIGTTNDTGLFTSIDSTNILAKYGFGA
jgi:hypothetical protein